jgi:MFS transporter, BCD family, chlorophyll transporter
MMKFLWLAFKTLRLALLRVGAGWMFALLTFNFNRVSISDLGAMAVIVTSLIGMHHFISFFQVYWGRIADRNPLFGLRRTPYIVLSGLCASLVFLALPSIAIGLGERSLVATLEAVLLIGVFGICMAANGSSSNSLIAEVTTPKERGGVVAFVWATVIISGIVSAAVAGQIMPSYNPELLAIMGIFLQDAILEPYGAEVFGMNQAATAKFQQSWGSGALLGMLGIGILSGIFPISKKLIATLGGVGVAGGLGLIGMSAIVQQQALINPGLMIMGVGIGLFNVGALSMMMEMTVEGQTGLYMGLWGMAQGLGNGFANVLSGSFHTGLIETGILTPAGGYALIFFVEAGLMVVAIAILRSISVQEFKGLSREDIGTTLALENA